MSLVSIVLPVFEDDEGLERAVKSVLVQKHQKFELIVVSRDQINYKKLLGTKRIHDDRIKIVYSHADDEFGAILDGIEASKGSLLTIMSCTERMYPFKLAKLVPLLADTRVAVDAFVVVDGEDVKEGVMCRDYSKGYVADYLNDSDILPSPVFTRIVFDDVIKPESVVDSKQKLYGALIQENGGAYLLDELLHEKFI